MVKERGEHVRCNSVVHECDTKVISSDNKGKRTVRTEYKCSVDVCKDRQTDRHSECMTERG